MPPAYLNAGAVVIAFFYSANTNFEVTICPAANMTIEEIAAKHAGLKSGFSLGVILVMRTLITPLHAILPKEDPKILIAELVSCVPLSGIWQWLRRFFPSFCGILNMPCIVSQNLSTTVKQKA